MEKMLATRVTGLTASAIREIFKLIGQSDIISLAGGVPSSELFPAQELGDIAKSLLCDNAKVSLQYGVTEGYQPLLDLTKLRNQNNLTCDSNLIITSGGQQAIDLYAKTVVQDGDLVIVESPSFIGALNSFRSYNANLIGVPVNDDGLDLETLEQIAKKQPIKLVYTIPTFQNPSGITMSLEKRKTLIDFAEKYDFLILEDNPYGELSFGPQNVPTIKSLDTTGRVAYAGSYSKILSPGMRVGYLITVPEILERAIICKQVSDVHTTILTQMMVYEFIKNYDMEQHIQKAAHLYGERCSFMLECMDECFPEFVTYTRPKGGLFIWCTINKPVDSLILLKKCVEKGVAFVPGNTFMTNMDKVSNNFRLNFSVTDKPIIEKGITLIGEALNEMVGETLS